MSRFKTMTVFLGLLALPFSAQAKDGGLALGDSMLVQGGITVVSVSPEAECDTVTGTFMGKNLAFIQDGLGGFFSLLGVDMNAGPGAYPVSVKLQCEGRKNQTKSRTVVVSDANFPVQKLTLPPKKVFPDSAAMARIKRETALRNRKWSRWDRQAHWEGDFIRPLEGEMRRFGHRRIINDAPRSPHSGVDISAPEGTPVACPARGRVILTGDFFFTGKTVYLDHGLGLVDMFFHLSRIDVAEGEMVEQGQVLGAVGSTGRATGPHLHWGIRYRGSRINPAALLELYSD
ncbi:MAG: M23 family metallopeptidase [Gemmatimonadota bacterium]|nr:M23 family metallopeptidase [Gemmatimonadota bacterium]